MVLLSNDNHMIIRKHHILKSLDDKKIKFTVEVIPATEKELMESMPTQHIIFTDAEIKQIMTSTNKVSK